MAIETLSDVIEEVCDRIGVYGGHDDDEPHPCRICVAGNLRDRILAAVEIERRLYPSDFREEAHGKR